MNFLREHDLEEAGTMTNYDFIFPSNSCLGKY